MHSMNISDLMARQELDVKKSRFDRKLDIVKPRLPSIFKKDNFVHCLLKLLAEESTIFDFNWSLFHSKTWNTEENSLDSIAS